MRAGSEMRFFRPWAPKAPSMTLEAPYRQPIVQKGGIVIWSCVDGFVVGEVKCRCSEVGSSGSEAWKTEREARLLMCTAESFQVCLCTQKISSLLNF